jgi:hypothetical protein
VSVGDSNAHRRIRLEIDNPNHPRRIAAELDGEERATGSAAFLRDGTSHQVISLNKGFSI